MANSNQYLNNDVHTHMLGLIVSIMHNYSIKPSDILDYYYDDADAIVETNSVKSETENEITPLIKNSDVSWDIPEADYHSWGSKTESEITPLIKNNDYSWVTTSTVKRSWASEYDSEESDRDVSLEVILEAPVQDKKMYVTHRRAFRDAISNGIKICSHYDDCADNNCLRFHVLRENLCPHAGRNNYCDNPSCDKIVIQACRKGRKCTNNTCSFRH